MEQNPGTLHALHGRTADAGRATVSQAGQERSRHEGPGRLLQVPVEQVREDFHPARASRDLAGRARRRQAGAVISEYLYLSTLLLYILDK